MEITYYVANLTHAHIYDLTRLSHNMDAQAPWSGGQQPDQVTIGASQPQPQTIAGIPTNTQVIYVQAPAFKPNPNYRHISYLVLGIGIVLSVTVGMMDWVGGSYQAISSSMCCGAIGIACMLDAMYYNDKSNWQQQTGGDTGGSTIGMIVDILFGVLCFGMALFYLLIGGI